MHGVGFGYISSLLSLQRISCKLGHQRSQTLIVNDEESCTRISVSDLLVLVKTLFASSNSSSALTMAEKSELEAVASAQTVAAIPAKHISQLDALHEVRYSHA